jgi:hypothetical protein
MILPREVSHRVTGDESGPPQNTFEITGCQAEFERVDPPNHKGILPCHRQLRHGNRSVCDTFRGNASR